MRGPTVEPVVTQVHVPPGMLGPDPVSFEVRCFVVADAGRVVLVDTCTPGTSEAIGRAIESVGAGWSDVTDIVLTHSHSTTWAVWPRRANKRREPPFGLALRTLPRSRQSLAESSNR